MYRKSFTPIKYSALLTLLLIAALCACDKSTDKSADNSAKKSTTTPAQQHDYSIFAFGTLIDISLYDVDEVKAQAAFEQLQNNFDRYHQD